MFINQALAQTTEAATKATVASESLTSIMTSMMPMLLILAVFYFLIIRPQNKRIQEHRHLINNLKKGDKIITSGGIIGKVKKIINDDEVSVEIAEGIDVHIVRSTIASIKEPFGAPANTNHKA